MTTNVELNTQSIKNSCLLQIIDAGLILQLFSYYLINGNKIIVGKDKMYYEHLTLSYFEFLTALKFY